MAEKKEKKEVKEEKKSTKKTATSKKADVKKTVNMASEPEVKKEKKSNSEKDEYEKAIKEVETTCDQVMKDIGNFYDESAKEVEKTVEDIKNFIFGPDGKFNQADLERIRVGVLDVLAGSLGFIGSIFKGAEKTINKWK